MVGAQSLVRATPLYVVEAVDDPGHGHGGKAHPKITPLAPWRNWGHGGVGRLVES